MDNQLVKKETMTLAEMTDMAKLFVDSKMFADMNAVSMAFVKIQAGKEIGISPFAAMSGIHIIKGKASIGAGLMAGCVKGSGKYDYRVIKMDDTICSIDFLQNGKPIGTSTFTIADAKKAGTQNLDKFPKNMLFARAMSNGVKWFTPDVFTMPVYTPEELGSSTFTEDITHEVIEPVAEKTKDKKVVSAKFMESALSKINAEPDADKRIEMVNTIKNGYLLSPDQLAQLSPFEAVSITESAQ